MLVKLTYFKRSGKLYTSGAYNTKLVYAFEIYQEVAKMRQMGELPGLQPSPHQINFVVLVEPIDNGVPQLIGADDANDILKQLLALGPRHDRQLSEPTDEDQRRWNDWDSEYAALFDRAKRIGVVE